MAKKKKYLYRDPLSAPKFCPRCAGQNIENDNHFAEDYVKEAHHDWLCLSCGFGFKLSVSRRTECANRLFNYHRWLNVRG